MAGEGNEGSEGTGFEHGSEIQGAETQGAEIPAAWFSSQDEYLGTLGEFGEPMDGPPRRRTGRRAAAAVGIAVALGAGGYGIAVAAGGQGSTSTGTAALPVSQTSSGTGTAPGCRGAFVRGAVGTLTSDSGSTLTVEAPDNTTRTVNTNASTVAVRIAAGSLADVANGDQVLVGGSYADNTLTAKNIVTGSGLDQGSVKAPQGSASWLGRGFASGTVTGKSSTGFTVVTNDGAHVAVAAPSSVTVETAVKISVSALKVGQRVAVAGTPDASGTITATQVEELDTTPALPGPALGFGFGPGFGFGFGGPGGTGARGFMQHGDPATTPSSLPSAVPQPGTPPKGFGGFGRGHVRVPGACGSATPTPSASASSANSGA